MFYFLIDVTLLIIKVQLAMLLSKVLELHAVTCTYIHLVDICIKMIRCYLFGYIFQGLFYLFIRQVVIRRVSIE